MTALLEYRLTVLLEYINPFKRAHVPPSLKDESKFYATINCCVVLLLLATHC